MADLTDLTDFPPLSSCSSSSSSSKKLKRQENKAKKLHAYFELLKEKQPSASFDPDDKLTKPSSTSAHLKPRFIIEADDLVRSPMGQQGVSQSVRLRSTLHSLGDLHPVGQEAKKEAQRKREELKKKPPLIHPFDVQRLILRALLGNDYRPRWCKLKNQRKLAKVVCVVVEGVAAADWYHVKASCPNLSKLANKEGGPVELHPSYSGDAEALRRLLHSVPLTISDLTQFNVDEGVDGNSLGKMNREIVDGDDDVVNGNGGVHRGENGVEEVVKNARQIDNADVANSADGTDPTTTTSPAKPSSWKDRLVAKTLADDAKRAMETDGLVTWVDVNRHSDAFKRTFLLLDADAMIVDDIPTPYTVRVKTDEDDEDDENAYWTLGCEEGKNVPLKNDDLRHESSPTTALPSSALYLPVTPSSPLYAVDVEMCRAGDGSFIPVWIAVVDERLDSVYSSLIKPSRPIVDYLTQYSGVNKATLRGVTTTMKDVVGDLRRLLPGDAILAGHSIGCDLESLKLVHPYVVDTVKILNLKGDPELKSKLRDLTKHLLGRNIQEFSSSDGRSDEKSSDSSTSSTSAASTAPAPKKPKGHNPVVDARATMELVLLKLRNHPLFGNLAYPVGVVPDEWQTMPVKFIKWYEEVAKRQKAMRDGEAKEIGDQSSASSTSSYVNGRVTLDSQSTSGIPSPPPPPSGSPSPSPSPPPSGSPPFTPSSSTKRLLSIEEETESRSKLARDTSPSPPMRDSARDSSPSPPMRDSASAATTKPLTLEEAFRSTLEIFPSSDVEGHLARDGKTATRFTVASQGEITIDRIQEGFYTTFVVSSGRRGGAEERGGREEEWRRKQLSEDLPRRVDECVGKIREYLPDFTLLTVAFTGRKSGSAESTRRGSSSESDVSSENGILLADIVRRSVA